MSDSRRPKITSSGKIVVLLNIVILPILNYILYCVDATAFTIIVAPMVLHCIYLIYFNSVSLVDLLIDAMSQMM